MYVTLKDACESVGARVGMGDFASYKERPFPVVVKSPPDSKFMGPKWGPSE